MNEALIVVHEGVVDALLDLQVEESRILSAIKSKFSSLYKIAVQAIKKPKTVLKNEKEIDKALDKVAKQAKSKEDVFKKALAVTEAGELLKDEESNIILKVLKGLFVAVPGLARRAVSIFNPFSWLVLYIVKAVATKNQIDMLEAWKRLFGFSLEQARRKWTPKMILLFSTRMLSHLLGLTGTGAFIYGVFAASGKAMLIGASSMFLAFVIGIIVSLKLMAAALRDMGQTKSEE